MFEPLELLAVDDFVLADYGIPPGGLTDQSSSLSFGTDRRAGVYNAVFFGSSSVAATWHVIFRCPDESSRNALMAVLAAPRNEQVRLLAQRSLYGEDLITTEAAITSVRPHGSSDNLEVNFESNDSVWFARDGTTVSKTFASPLDQTIHLPVGGNIPTHPVIRITPTAQRAATTAAVGWSLRRRFAISNEGDEPLFRYAVIIPIGDTAALVTAGKALASGDDLRVWLHGLEQSRTLAGWNTTATFVWVIVPALPPGESLTYEVVYGNALATADDGVELVYPDLPAFDLSASTNYLWVYRTATDIDNAGQGLWPLSSALEGGSADYGVPGAWQPTLTFENPNNTDSYVQSRAQQLQDGAGEWYQARLYAARWRGPGFDDFDAYAGSDPFDGVTIHNPFGVRSVHSDGIVRRNDAFVKTVVTTTVGAETASDEVLAPEDPPFTRAVVIGRNSGGEGWHVLAEYGETVAEGHSINRLYLPSGGGAAIFPGFAAGWENTSNADRIAATSTQGSTAMTTKTAALGTTAADYDVLLRQYVYPLLAGTVFTTADTVKGQVRAFESTLSANARSQLVIRVMTATSVVRATLLDFDTAALGSEFDTNYINRKFPRVGAVALQANYTTVAGDYLVMELGARKHATAAATVGLYLGEAEAAALPEDETSSLGFYPWIEFSTELAPAAASLGSLSANWTPPRPVKHFGVACWPAGGVQIPEEAESRVFIESDGDITVHIAAESLIITEIEAETEIYELATELRLHGGANAVGPYHTLLVGNARQVAGPGTPRAALALDTQGLQIDTERRTHTLWNPAFTVQQEMLSTHAVRALAGSLREVDATDIPALQRIPVTIPNSTFDSNLTGWELELDDAGWSYTVTHDAAVGGEASGSLKFTLTTVDVSTVLYRSSTYVAVDAQDSVEITAWLRQGESGASSPRLGVIWYDAGATPLATQLDQITAVALSPATDHQLVFAGTPPAGATQFRVMLGVTAVADAPGTKWFDDVQATIIRPLRYDAALSRATEESRASQWLPLSPPRRTVANGGFDADLSSWELYDDGTGITYTATHDTTIGGEQNGSLKIAITANTGSDAVSYLNSQFFGVNGQERVEMSAWLRTSDADLHPKLAMLWYEDGSDTAIAISLEPAWPDDPAANAEYTRAFAAIVPPEATRFRLAVVADAVVSAATGSCWFDDIRLNDNELLLADVAMGELGVVATIRPRWVP